MFRFCACGSVVALVLSASICWGQPVISLRKPNGERYEAPAGAWLRQQIDNLANDMRDFAGRQRSFSRKRQDLRQLSDEIESWRRRLNRSNRSEVVRFNARVSFYNSRLRSLRIEQESFDAERAHLRRRYLDLQARLERFLAQQRQAESSTSSDRGGLIMRDNTPNR